MSDFSPADNEQRVAAFNAWVRTHAEKQGFRLLSPGAQGLVHRMLRLAFYAGSNWQRARHRKQTRFGDPT